MSKSQTNKTKPSIFQNKAFIVVLGLIILLIFYFIIKLIPTDNTPVEQMKTSEQESNLSIQFKKEGTLSFLSSKGDTLANIDIELADTENKRMQGLMYRKTMEEKQGMLFVFSIEEPQSFWMKNTILPLDILFVNIERKIVKVHKNAVPFSLDPCPSILPALYVVEVNAGFTDKFNIKEGDIVNWNILR